MDKPITYLLSQKNCTDCTEFYSIIGEHTDHVRAEAQDRKLYRIVNQYEEYITINNLENMRSSDEYLLEYLMIGIFWSIYIENAMALGRFFYWVSLALYNVRQSSLKPLIDPIRGVVTAVLQRQQIDEGQASLGNFVRLIKWLQATGDFNEEVERLKNWKGFFTKLSQEESLVYLQNAVDFGSWFQQCSKEKLGKYTYNVAGFSLNEYRNYRFREDAIFCGRAEVEYHLNMVGAEIMNQALYAKFSSTKEKVVLLPQCMSKNFRNGCCAKKNEADFFCTCCTADCNINLIKQIGESEGFKVRIIPHSTNFSKSLKQWQNQMHTGVVGIACILNLLTGGYEMRKLSIPSQCIFLNYCGCIKHWSRTGISTNIDVNRLSRMLSGGLG
jgi:hypothetical protein